MNRLLGRLSLRALLTAPYLLLVIGVAGGLAGLHYRNGERAADGWSGQLMAESIERMRGAVERQVSASEAVLEAAFPAGVAAPASVERELDALRQRFWVATSIALTPNNYVYYGDRSGHFLGLWRYSRRDAELRLRTDGSGARQVLPFSGIDGALGQARVEQRIFEPRERPWYWVGVGSVQGAWSPVYVDFRTGELVITRARRVETGTRELGGVVATDLSLQAIGELLRAVRLPPGALALLVERDGGLIALSHGSPVTRNEDDRPQQLNAADHADPRVARAFAAMRKALDEQALAEAQGQPQEAPARLRSQRVELPDGGTAQLAWTRLHDARGMDWLAAVIAPRRALLAEARADFRDGLWLALAAALAVLVVGLAVLRTLRQELTHLAAVAQRIGAGEGRVAVDTRRHDELGELGRSLEQMQDRLLTDALTGVANREAALRRLAERMVQRRRRDDGRRLGLLFVDFDDFKQINDRFGHDAGDRVLQEMAQRLAARVRSQDLVARYAGDEFLVVLDGLASRADAEAVRKHLSASLDEPLAALAAVGAPAFPHGASIGLAVFPDDAEDVDSLIRMADADMYRRKGKTPPS